MPINKLILGDNLEIQNMIKFLSIIALLALLGCAGNKPMPEQKANKSDDPRCGDFYEFSDKRMNIDPEGFEELKKDAEEIGYHIENPYDLLEISFTQNVVLANLKIRCNKVITCNQKEYCISFISSSGYVSYIEF